MDLITGKDKALLIDSGYGNAQLPSVVKSLTDLPLEVAITHAHTDHMGAVSEFHQPVLLSEDEYYRICKDTKTRFFPEVRECFTQYPPVLLSDHEKIDLGGIIFEAIKTPGHTAGSMSFYNETTRELFTSDSFCPAIMLWEPLNESISRLKNTAKIISAMDIRQLWIGHDIKPVNPSAIRLYYEAVMLTQNASNIMDVGGTDNISICCSDRWKQEITGKTIPEIYQHFVDRPDFACVFLMHFYHE